MVVDQSRRHCLLCGATFTGRAFVCQPCAERYRDAEIPERVLREFYTQVDQQYPEWANTFGNYNPPRALIRKLDELHPGSRILEIGAGGGFLLNELLGHGFHRLVGCDITVSALREMKNRSQSLFVVGADANALPFTDGSFDAVISSDVIEHLVWVDQHISEVHRVLRPGGRYYLKTPNRRPAELFYRMRGLYDYHIWHPSMFSSSELRESFSNHGFFVEFLAVGELTDAQIRKIPTAVARSVLSRMPLQWLPTQARPHLEAVATRLP
jgi:SAM-dependent methyltransferase